MTIRPLSNPGFRISATQDTSFAVALRAGKDTIPFFESLGRKGIPVGKGGHEVEVITAATIAGALKARFGGQGFTYNNLRDMLEAAGWDDDDIQCPDGKLGVINKLQDEFGLDKIFTFDEAGELFANRFASEFKGEGMTKTEAQTWGVAK